MLSYMYKFVCFCNMQDFYSEFFTQLQEYGLSIAIPTITIPAIPS